jgi:tRNA nucleotidyltransferase (CCA-adding enzyme)
MSEQTDLLRVLEPDLLAKSIKLAKLFQDAGGNLLLVGGTVRDLIMGQSPSELDIEARGLTIDQIKDLLSPSYKFNEVGKAFGVLKLKGHPIEIALPRTEIKSGSGHKGFSITADPHLPYTKAVQRRDFTINAIGLDPLNGNFLDPCDGKKDISQKILRHIGPAFGEDPLRVLRGAQFIARFDLSPTKETLEVCRSMQMEDLPAERIYEEWKKLLLKGVNLSAGLNFIKDTNWTNYFPELNDLIGCKQDPEWHPEGDVWVHTLHCLDAFARERIGEEWEDLVVGFAILCHDLGKPLTTKIGEDGRIRSPMHEPEGETPTRSFLSRLTEQVDLHEEVVPLVRRHLTPRTFYKDQASDGAIRRLAGKVKRIDRLVRVAAADIAGRPPRKDEFPEGPWLLKRAEELEVKDSEPKPIILGRHLIDRGLKPGLEFSPILEQCFEKQLDGTFRDLNGGLSFLDHLLESRD